jgi:tetratricopeptide (TPR) repeat protein
MRKARYELRTPVSRRVGLLLACGLVVGACSGGAPASSDSTDDIVRSTPATVTTTSTTATASPSTTTNSYGGQRVEVTERLGCSDTKPGGDLVEADSTLECVTQFASDTLILFFASDAQRDRHFGYFQPTSVILGPDWVVTTSSGAFTDADQVALAVDGIVVKRALETEGDAPDPPELDDIEALSSEDAWNALEDGLAVAQDGDTESAIPLFNLVIASTHQKPDEPALRSAAILNRGIAYENLMTSHPDWNPEDLSTEVLLSYNWLLDEFGETDDPDVQPAVVQGAFKLGLFYGNRQVLEEAVEAFDKAIRAGIDSVNSNVKCGVADAMINRAVALNLLGDTDAAFQQLEDLIDTFADETTPCVTAVLSDARAALEQAP